MNVFQYLGTEMFLSLFQCSASVKCFSEMTFHRCMYFIVKMYTSNFKNVFANEALVRPPQIIHYYPMRRWR